MIIDLEDKMIVRIFFENPEALPVITIREFQEDVIADVTGRYLTWVTKIEEVTDDEICLDLWDTGERVLASERFEFSGLDASRNRMLPFYFRVDDIFNLQALIRMCSRIGRLSRENVSIFYFPDRIIVLPAEFRSLIRQTLDYLESDEESRERIINNSGFLKDAMVAIWRDESSSSAYMRTNKPDEIPLPENVIRFPVGNREAPEFP